MACNDQENLIWRHTKNLNEDKKMRIFVTGSAGFVGYHLAKRLLEDGHQVHGFDGFTDYYDIALKRARQRQLEAFNAFSSTEAMLEEEAAVLQAVQAFRPDIIVHLAAQAGVRYSLEAPRSYLSANVVGTFNVLEAATAAEVKHCLVASTSSIYGANDKVPFGETDKADHQLTIYAATKKAAESMAHAHAHLWHLPITMFRFFTVYGPWGRPDMAYFKFVDAIQNDRAIDVYNDGDMSRDFTYIDDLVTGIQLLMDVVPKGPQERETQDGDTIAERDSLSPVAPFRVVNIGNATPVNLAEFIEEIERALGKTAHKNYMPMQMGDVPATWANTQLLADLTGFRPTTDLRSGISAFVEWYRSYYKSQ